MSLIAAVRTDSSTDVLTSLQAVCDSQGLVDLAHRTAGCDGPGWIRNPLIAKPEWRIDGL